MSKVIPLELHGTVVGTILATLEKGNFIDTNDPIEESDEDLGMEMNSYEKAIYTTIRKKQDIVQTMNDEFKSLCAGYGLQDGDMMPNDVRVLYTDMQYASEEISTMNDMLWLAIRKRAAEKLGLGHYTLGVRSGFKIVQEFSIGGVIQEALLQAMQERM